MNQLSTDNLAELIRRKHQILMQLRDIGLRQEKLVDDSATTALLQLLGAKQHLIGALQMVERGLRPFQVEDPDDRHWRCDADRAACAERAEECRRLLGEVMKLERSQEAKMIERRNEVAEQLRRAGTANQAVGAYALHRGSSRVVDTQDKSLIVGRLDLSSGSS